MEVEDIHLNRPVRTIVNRRADTYIQHPHIEIGNEPNIPVSSSLIRKLLHEGEVCGSGKS